MNTLDKKTNIHLESKVLYRIYLPNEYDKNEDKMWPLILYLHGSGESGTDLNKLDRFGLTSYLEHAVNFPFITLAPLCPENEIWDINYKATMALMELILKNYRVDPKRIYLTGISMGGCGAWHFGILNPDFFAAIVPVCGFAAIPRAVAVLKDKPIWTFHGKQDSSVPFEITENLVKVLGGVSETVRFTKYEDKGHEVCTLAYHENSLYEWLLKQHL